MFLWELIMLILMIVMFNSVRNLGRLVTSAISKTSHPIWIVLKKYFRY